MLGSGQVFGNLYEKHCNLYKKGCEMGPERGYSPLPRRKPDGGANTGGGQYFTAREVETIRGAMLYITDILLELQKTLIKCNYKPKSHLIGRGKRHYTSYGNYR